MSTSSLYYRLQRSPGVRLFSMLNAPSAGSLSRNVRQDGVVFFNRRQRRSEKSEKHDLRSLCLLLFNSRQFAFARQCLDMP